MYQRVYIMAELCKGLATKIDYVFNRISVTLIDSNGPMIQKMIKARYGLSFDMSFYVGESINYSNHIGKCKTA